MTATALIEDALAFRATMSRLPSGVSVVTTQTGRVPVGMTASSVTALSLEPLQLLVCVANHLFTKTAIAEHGRFGVNVLGEGHGELATQFASPGDRFAGVSYDVDHGVPVLHDAIATIVCDVAEAFPGGDHTIFVGSVRHYEHSAHGRPLIHCAGEFGRIA